MPPMVEEEGSKSGGQGTVRVQCVCRGREESDSRVTEGTNSTGRQIGSVRGVLINFSSNYSWPVVWR